MSQDLLIPFIPNINHTQPMSKNQLTVSRVTKRPVPNKDEEHPTESEQMETLTYLDALREKMRDAHQHRSASYDFVDNEEVEPHKSMVAEAIKMALRSEKEETLVTSGARKTVSQMSTISERKHLDVFA